MTSADNPHYNEYLVATKHLFEVESFNTSYITRESLNKETEYISTTTKSWCPSSLLQSLPAHFYKLRVSPSREMQYRDPHFLFFEWLRITLLYMQMQNHLYSLIYPLTLAHKWMSMSLPSRKSILPKSRQKQHYWTASGRLSRLVSDRLVSLDFKLSKPYREVLLMWMVRSQLVWNLEQLVSGGTNWNLLPYPWFHNRRHPHHFKRWSPCNCQHHHQSAVCKSWCWGQNRSSGKTSASDSLFDSRAL